MKWWKIAISSHFQKYSNLSLQLYSQRSRTSDDREEIGELISSFISIEHSQSSQIRSGLQFAADLKHVILVQHSVVLHHESENFDLFSSKILKENPTT